MNQILTILNNTADEDARAEYIETLPKERREALVKDLMTDGKNPQLSRDSAFVEGTGIIDKTRMIAAVTGPKHAEPATEFDTTHLTSEDIRAVQEYINIMSIVSQVEDEQVRLFSDDFMPPIAPVEKTGTWNKETQAEAEKLFAFLNSLPEEVLNEKIEELRAMSWYDPKALLGDELIEGFIRPYHQLKGTDYLYVTDEGINMVKDGRDAFMDTMKKLTESPAATKEPDPAPTPAAQTPAAPRTDNQVLSKLAQHMVVQGYVNAGKRAVKDNEPTEPQKEYIRNLSQQELSDLMDKLITSGQFPDLEKAALNGEDDTLAALYGALEKLENIATIKMNLDPAPAGREPSATVGDVTLTLVDGKFQATWENDEIEAADTRDFMQNHGTEFYETVASIINDALKQGMPLRDLKNNIISATLNTGIPTESEAILSGIANQYANTYIRQNENELSIQRSAHVDGFNAVSAGDGQDEVRKANADIDPAQNRPTTMNI